jgi:hypothetical protein
MNDNRRYFTIEKKRKIVKEVLSNLNVAERMYAVDRKNLIKWIENQKKYQNADRDKLTLLIKEGSQSHLKTTMKLCNGY